MLADQGMNTLLPQWDFKYNRFLYFTYALNTGRISYTAMLYKSLTYVVCGLCEMTLDSTPKNIFYLSNQNILLCVEHNIYGK